MKFEFYKGLIWVSVNLTYDGKSMHIENCIFDTGSATTALDIDLVDFNYNKPSTLKRLVGIGGGTQEVINQKIDKIALDHVMLESVEIEFGDIRADLGINGFIGNDILSLFDVDIRYSDRQIFLTPIG
jgi:hypothetical protein